MMENRAYARALWYTVAAVVAIGAMANIFERIVCRSRQENPQEIRLTSRLRSASLSKINPRPSLLGLYSPIVFVTTTLREMSYPQPFIFRRWVFFNPPPLGQIYVVAGYIILILTLLFADSIVS